MAILRVLLSQDHFVHRQPEVDEEVAVGDRQVLRRACGEVPRSNSYRLFLNRCSSRIW
jgi:hypothetical protein